MGHQGKHYSREHLDKLENAIIVDADVLKILPLTMCRFPASRSF